MAITPEINLGSGDLYITTFTRTSGVPVIPLDTAIEVAANQVGFIKGGATLEYKPDIYEGKDDSGYVSKRYLVGSEVTFKSGFGEWCINDLGKLMTNAKVTDNTTGLVTLKVGGGIGSQLDEYLIHFVHTNLTTGNKMRVTLVGNQVSGSTLAFKAPKEGEIMLDVEFKALPCDSDKNLVIITEEYETE